MVRRRSSSGESSSSGNHSNTSNTPKSPKRVRGNNINNVVVGEKKFFPAALDAIPPPPPLPVMSPEGPPPETTKSSEKLLPKMSEEKKPSEEDACLKRLLEEAAEGKICPAPAPSAAAVAGLAAAVSEEVPQEVLQEAEERVSYPMAIQSLTAAVQAEYPMAVRQAEKKEGGSSLGEASSQKKLAVVDQIVAEACARAEEVMGTDVFGNAVVGEKGVKTNVKTNVVSGGGAEVGIKINNNSSEDLNLDDFLADGDIFLGGENDLFSGAPPGGSSSSSSSGSASQVKNEKDNASSSSSARPAEEAKNVRGSSSCASSEVDSELAVVLGSTKASGTSSGGKLSGREEGTSSSGQKFCSAENNAPQLSPRSARTYLSNLAELLSENKTAGEAFRGLLGRGVDEGKHF